MAIFKSNQLTNMDATPNVFASTNEDGGVLHHKQGTYTFAATAAGSKVEMVRVPKGARILPLSMLQWDSLGASTTLRLGIDGVEGNLSRGHTIDGSIGRNSGAALATQGWGWAHMATGGYDVNTATAVFLQLDGASATGLVVLDLYFTSPSD
jgi:hypothetical protein